MKHKKWNRRKGLEIFLFTKININKLTSFLINKIILLLNKLFQTKKWNSQILFFFSNLFKI